MCRKYLFSTLNYRLKGGTAARLECLAANEKMRRSKTAFACGPLLARLEELRDDPTIRSLPSALALRQPSGFGEEKPSGA